jgi:hypothetical protein
LEAACEYTNYVQPVSAESSMSFDINELDELIRKIFSLFSALISWADNSHPQQAFGEMLESAA